MDNRRRKKGKKETEGKERMKENGWKEDKKK